MCMYVLNSDIKNKHRKNTQWINNSGYLGQEDWAEGNWADWD